MAGISNRMEMTIEDVQRDIIGEFSVYEDWLDKYSYLIELGKDLPSLLPAEKIDEYLIKGMPVACLACYRIKGWENFFQGESDAVIVRGLVALLLRVVSGRTPGELLENNLHFIDDIGLKQHLSPARSNGLLAMVKQIRLYAVAYNEILNKEQRNG